MSKKESPFISSGSWFQSPSSNCFALIHLPLPLYSYLLLPPKKMLLPLVLLIGSLLIIRSDKHVNTHTDTHAQMYTNTLVSWVLYTNNHKSEVVQIWDGALGELDLGPRIAVNCIGDFENVIFLLWTSIAPFEKWWVWIWGCSFQL